MTKTMTPQEYLEYLPDNYIGLSMDKNKKWYAVTEKPECLETEFRVKCGDGYLIRVSIEYSGNWKDSWTSRKLTFGDLEVGCEFNCNHNRYIKTNAHNADRMVRHAFNHDAEVTLND